MTQGLPEGDDLIFLSPWELLLCCGILALSCSVRRLDRTYMDAGSHRGPGQLGA